MDIMLILLEYVVLFLQIATKSISMEFVLNVQQVLYFQTVYVTEKLVTVLFTINQQIYADNALVDIIWLMENATDFL